MDVKLIHTVERAVLQVYLDEENRLKAEEQARIEEKNRLEEEARLAKLEEEARLAKLEEEKRLEEEKLREEESLKYIKDQKREERRNSSIRNTLYFAYNSNINYESDSFGISLCAAFSLWPYIFFYGEYGAYGFPESSLKEHGYANFFFSVGGCFPIVKYVKAYSTIGGYLLLNDNINYSYNGLFTSFGCDILVPLYYGISINISPEYRLLFDDEFKDNVKNFSIGVGLYWSID